MQEPYMHPQTKKDLQSYFQRPSHGLLLSGAESSGKKFLAKHVARKLMGEQNSAVGLSIYTGLNMGIEDVRKLLKQLNLTLPGADFSKRVIIIEDIDRLGHEAQNSLLKILEEPPKSTFFIATSSEPNAILPTVISRMSILHVRPIMFSQMKSIFGEEHSQDEIIRAYHLSEGNASLLLSVLESKDHELLEAIEWAKNITKSTAYQRLLMVDDLCKNKAEKLDTYLYGLQKILRATILHSKSADAARSKRRVAQLDLVLKARENLNANVSPKLLLTNLFMHL